MRRGPWAEIDHTSPATSYSWRWRYVSMIGLAHKLGFALQLCVLRYPGRLLAPGEFIPPAVVDFIGRQLDLDGYELG